MAEVLRQAAGEGRIDIEELDQRLEATYPAKTYGELVPITADLPTGPGPSRVATSRPAALADRPAVLQLGRGDVGDQADRAVGARGRPHRVRADGQRRARPARTPGSSSVR